MGQSWNDREAARLSEVQERKLGQAEEVGAEIVTQAVVGSAAGPESTLAMKSYFPPESVLANACLAVSMVVK
jgi:hypothetical protein